MSQNKILQTIKQHKRFLLSTHVNPDPDAICSELAMAIFLRQLGKTVTIVNEEKIPPRFAFLPGSKKIKVYKKGLKVSYDAVIVLDCGELDRIGQVKNLLRKDAVILNIDHHITNDFFGHVHWVEPNSSSTAEVLYELFQTGRCRWTNPLALHLYAGIMTDTGSFRHSNTSPRTHQIAGELRKFPFSATELYRRFYESISLADLKYFTKVVSSFDSLYRGRVICVELREKILSRFSDEFDLRDAIFKFLRSIKGTQIFVIFTEQSKNETRVNFRASGKVNVAQLAYFFKGGGHSNASGCRISKPLKKARADVLKQIRIKLSHVGKGIPC